MYVCVCKGVTESALRQAIAQGHTTQRQLATRLQVGRDCGKCRRDVAELLAAPAACPHSCNRC